MFSPAQKIREYRAEQKRHAQIAREIDDALTNRHLFHQPFRPIDPAYRALTGAEIQPAARVSANFLQSRPLKLGERAGY